MKLKPQKVLVIGSGPIVIGQAAEFDYAGTQACQALKEEGVEVILVNSNPATIMTDQNIADRVYLEPLTKAALKYIIEKEKPDGLIATLGGQTGLNLAVELFEDKILQENKVQLLGTPLKAIIQAEDRNSFRTLMQELNEPIPQSAIISEITTGLEFAATNGYPVIVRPAYTLGGTGGGIATNDDQLSDILYKGLKYSPIKQVLIEKSVAGWKEIEYEVMRDSNDTCLIVCNMENIDPVGVHTGDSIVVAPSQTLTDNEYHMLRASAMRIIRALQIEGGCNIQFALNPLSSEYVVIEVNPRVSRSSALASKAAGYPIAKIAAKIAIGLHLDQIENAVTKKTKASFEPALDYVVTKIPKWPFDKFAYADRSLGTQMKATGEVMAIDRNFESSLLKAVTSLEGSEISIRKAELAPLSREQILVRLNEVDDQRLFLVFEALRKGISVNEIHQITKIDPWFLNRFHRIIKMEIALKEQKLDGELLKKAEAMGFTDQEIELLSKESASNIDALRRAHHIYPVYKMVDTCAQEFESTTPYYYSTFDTEDENIVSRRDKVIVIGSGPIRIGQGIEFDYCSVHCVWALKKLGYEAIIINNNPETVSTDFDVADKLYFEPLFIEDVYNVIRKEVPKGVIVQFGGQTAINLSQQLTKKGVQILGTSMDAIDISEDRKKFDRLLLELNIARPRGKGVDSKKEALEVAQEIGYPLLLRPSYVIGGRGMQICYEEGELIKYLDEAIENNGKYQIFVDQYIEGQELEIDAIADGEDVLIPGIMEHIEATGIHSGDSFSVYPSQNVSQQVKAKIVKYSKKIAKALSIQGILNIQFVVANEEVYIIEVNPRASRTVPILSKVTNIPMIEVAVAVIMGDKLKDLPYGLGLIKEKNFIAVKAPIFSFQKLTEVDSALATEMKSTGEVLGIAKDYDTALIKAFLAANFSFDLKGEVFLSLQKRDKEKSLAIVKDLQALDFSLAATDETAKFYAEHDISVRLIKKNNIEQIKEEIKGGKFALIINTATLGQDRNRPGFQIRNATQIYNIPAFTCLDTVKAYLKAYKFQQQKRQLKYESLCFYHQL